ncbi:hypothetical protein QJQ45_025249 [Haematococcus lacustris]|nr:hypothetical protein QJQ45_025249 [Haematococcus lacustris]
MLGRARWNALHPLGSSHVVLAVTRRMAGTVEGSPALMSVDQKRRRVGMHATPSASLSGADGDDPGDPVWELVCGLQLGCCRTAARCCTLLQHCFRPGIPMFANLRNGVHRVGSSSKVPGLRITNHVFRAPLDYSGEHPGEVEVFVRELVSPSHATRKDLPYLLFLQGGPGFESPRPCEASGPGPTWAGPAPLMTPCAPGWIKSAMNSFRVVLMDQRGTGLSSQITVKNLSVNRSPEQQAHYLSFFRADSIVRDAELVRQLLVPKDNYEGRWTLLGQSFGGFCALTYLSLAPEGLIEVLLTGGIPPCIDQACSATEVYRACYLRVLNANQRYYARFPDDVALVQRIVTFLAAQPRGGLLLPSGTRLTPRAFQLMGLSGLGTGGGFERLHYVLESFFDPSDPNEVTPGFIKTFESWMSWDTNPLYALLHESIYCQGAASQWAAQRVLDQEFRSEFDAVETAAEGRPVMLLGEMVFPWMFEDFAGLRPYQEAAQLLASKADWGRLYAPEVLAHNKVPVAAVTYVEDMFVDYHLAQRTASQVQGLRQWLTNEYKARAVGLDQRLAAAAGAGYGYHRAAAATSAAGGVVAQHTGIRDDGARILERLLSMVRDTLLLD